jgi:hypothetical protein
VPLSSKTNNGGTSYVLSLLCIIRTKSWCCMYNSVPSIVTKSPEITLKHFLGFDKAMRMATIARNDPN